MVSESLNKIFRLLALAAVFSLTVACSDDIFDVPVGERITPDEHYRTLEDAVASLYGTLSGLQDVAPDLILLDGLRSDQMDITPNAGSDIAALYNQEFNADNRYLDYSGLYRVIINVNEVLANIERAEEKDRDFKPNYLFDMRANLYGLRAWCYLNITRLYGVAVIIDDNLTSLPEDLSSMTPMSKADVIDKLISQFNSDSVIYDQDTASVARDQAYFPGFPNYKAVLGELYLEKQDYENAIYYLKLGLESAPAIAGDEAYKVDASYDEDAWESIFLNAENAILENMLVIPYSINQKQVNTMVELMLPNRSFMVKPSQVLVDSMEAQITTRRDTADVYRGMGVTYDTISSGNYFIKKYDIDDAQPFSSDIVLQRAGDVHLLLAEALNRNGQSDVALMFLNNGISGVSLSKRPAGYSAFSKNRGIRNRVLLQNREIPDSITGNERVERIEDLILQEKAMECAFEGKRMSDLIRVAERRDNPGEYIGNIIAAKYDSSMAEYVKQFYMNKENWYLPFH
ncbi:RagB/SusD family nutrient uptake outer membrane protein [Saccharicrinis sp. FJH2]|uniref:RagB/SusD family nutrient uptake outer membrane protein n=1 Tax=Saccharicrinis sp. FJH65 TaxID=3344659 RepID=UPI0035F48247